MSVGKAAGLLAGMYFLSSLLGLFRDRLLGAQFGLGGTLDAYFAAFSLPDVLFYVLTSGALAVTFIPILSEYLVKNEKKHAWELTSSLFNVLAIGTFFGGVLVFIFADPLMWLVAPSFDASRHDLAVDLTRIMALNPMLFAASSVLASLQQAFGRFFFFAIAPVMYNFGIIFGILVLSEDYGITGVALGVVIGAGLQLLVQALGLVGLNFDYRSKIVWDNKFKHMIRLLIPRSIDQGIDHLNAIVVRAIASGLAIGSIATYQYAFTLKNVPISLIGVAIATAVFPSISQKAAGNRNDLLRKEIADTIRAIVWLSLPAAAIALIMRGYITRLLLGFGSAEVASVLGWFSVAIVFQALLQLATRTFYAQQDTKTPLYMSIVAFVFNIVLAVGLARIHGIKGLAMAQSIVALVEVVMLLWVMNKRIGKLLPEQFFTSVLKISMATVAMASINYWLIKTFPLFLADVGFWSLAPKFSIIVIASLAIYIGLGYILRIEEAKKIVSYTKNRIFKPVSI